MLIIIIIITPSEVTPNLYLISKRGIFRNTRFNKMGVIALGAPSELTPMFRLVTLFRIFFTPMIVISLNVVVGILLIYFNFTT